VEVAKLLSDKGASVIASKERLAKMMCMCGYDGDLEKLKTLHLCEANLESADYDKRTLGHLAAAEGHVELLKYLIEETEYNFDLQDRWGNQILDELKDLEKKKELIKLIE